MKLPIVNPDQGKVIETKDGKAIVEFTVPSSGEMKLTGTVGIKDKNGSVKFANYETKVAVVSKGASVSLPEMNVLYTDWDNKVIVQTSAVTSDIQISGAGVNKRSATVNGV